MKIQEGKAKLLRTLNLYLMFLGLGMSVAIPGPTLLDLQRMVNTDSGHITYIYIARSVGHVIGSIVGGILLDKFNKEAILVMATMLMGISISLVPWWSTLFAIAINILINGMSMGCIDTGGNVCCLEIWSKESGIYLQILHFCFGIGALIAPLIVERFLYGHDNIDDFDLYVNSSSSELLSSGNIVPLNVTEESTEFPVRYAYAIVSGYIIIICIWSAIMFFILPKEKLSNRSQGKNNSIYNLPLFISIMSLITLLMCIICGIEIGFGQLITIFAVRSDLHLSESVGSYMTSVYWGTYTFARFFSIFLVIYSSLICPILFNLALIILASVCLTMFGNTVVEILWAGIALFGFGLSSMFPSVLAWLENHIPFNSKVTSMFVVGAALGETVLPLSVGYFIDEHPISLMYAGAICSCSCAVVFAVTWKLCSRYKKGESKLTPENLPPSCNEIKSTVETQYI